ncbi:MAG TPA: UPF0149 family protein [Candidatus Tumulicola sp.]|nr:UPF0149 family protein [Candidatus Tumulicola sp.]
MDLQRRLTKKERDELESLMELRDPAFAGPMQGSITRVHGFLTSVISGPVIVPSQWIPIVFWDEGDRGWENMKQVQRAMDLLMRFYNEIPSDLGPGDRRYSVLIDRLGDRPHTLDLATDWCRGYMLGTAMREDEWKEPMEAAELRDAFLPILAGAHPTEFPDIDPVKQPEIYQAMLDGLPNCALKICEWWREKLVASLPTKPGPPRSGTVRRDAQKVSPNAPCPCGSGKKYKRCCSGLRQ